MVATWSRSWFQSDGARAIYLLPRSEVDQVLPLHLQPRPRELVRTLVGRLEYVTPEVQAEVEQAVRGHDDPDPEVRAAAAARLRAQGRFLEPQLRNVARNGGDARVREGAQRLLATMDR
jgi:hypothetical protein